MKTKEKTEMKVIGRIIFKNDVPVAEVTGWEKYFWGISTKPEMKKWPYRNDMIRWIKANPELF